MALTLVAAGPRHPASQAADGTSPATRDGPLPSPEMALAATLSDRRAALTTLGSSEAVHLASDSDEADPGASRLPEVAPTQAPDRLARLRVPVLTYHVIAPWAVARSYSTADLDVSPELFDEHLRMLRDDGWRTITAEGLAQALATGRVPPARTAVITIDDGFADGYVDALPILQRYSFLATFYVVPGRMGEPNHLTWDQVRALAGAGMEIGNHTQAHLALTQLPIAEAVRQIADAQAAIEQATGQAPTTLAFPFGDVDDAVVAAVEAAGLSLAFTTRGGATETWATRFTLPRIHVGATLSASSLRRVLEPLR
jgi:peptidoglycan/xylan/chitin deacetylase (PgdA/CDA1 family)